MRLGKPAAVKPAPGSLPLPMGKATSKVEQEALAAFGYKPGDPVPANLAWLIAAAQADVQADAAAPPLPVAPDTPPMRPKRSVQLSELPPEHQAEITAALRQAKEQLAAAPAAPVIANAPPGLNEALRVASAPASEPGVAPPQPAPPQPAPSQPAPPRRCVRCGFDQNLGDDVVITDEDRRTFLAACRGGQRFRKRYALLGGQLRVTFRGLTAREWDTATQRVVYDGRADLEANQLKDPADYALTAGNYVLALSLERVEGVGPEPIDVDPLDEYEPTARPGESKLQALTREVFDAALPTDTLRRVVGAAHAHFRELLGRLEARGLDPNFWGATGTPA